jgi:hypothetical protein
MWPQEMLCNVMQVTRAAFVNGRLLTDSCQREAMTALRWHAVPLVSDANISAVQRLRLIDQKRAFVQLLTAQQLYLDSGQPVFRLLIKIADNR